MVENLETHLPRDNCTKQEMQPTFVWRCSFLGRLQSPRGGQQCRQTALDLGSCRLKSWSLALLSFLCVWSFYPHSGRTFINKLHTLFRRILQIWGCPGVWRTQGFEGLLAAKVRFSAEGKANCMCHCVLEEAKKPPFKAFNPGLTWVICADAYAYYQYLHSALQYITFGYKVAFEPYNISTGCSDPHFTNEEAEI